MMLWTPCLPRPAAAAPFLAALLLCVFLLPAAAQSNRTEARALCAAGEEMPAARRLAGCEWLLRAPGETPADLAWALSHRGNLRVEARDLPAALADYDAALRHDPRQS
ncbi:MAG: hypothetical protein ACK5PU_01760, partial [bacterium]